MNMNWNICNFIPPSIVLFFFSPLLFLAGTKFPPALGLLPRSTGWRAGGFICWEGHVSWWRLSLSFSGSSDTNLDASVLTASLRRCNMHPQRSINPFCNFISISPSPALPHRDSAPPHLPAYHLLRAWDRLFINMSSEHGYLKIAVWNTPAGNTQRIFDEMVVNGFIMTLRKLVT